MYNKSLLNYPSSKKKNSWLPLYLSLILIILTFFVALTSFSIRIKEKMKVFKKSYRESFIFIGGKSKGEISILNIGDADRLQFIINQMREKGIDEKSMRKYLKETDLLNLGVSVIKDGKEIVFPVKAFFKGGSTEIDPKKYYLLLKVLPLVKYLPYYVTIKSYPDSNKVDFLKAFELAGKRAYSVFQFFKEEGVYEKKLSIESYSFAPEDKKASFSIVFSEEE